MLGRTTGLAVAWLLALGLGACAETGRPRFLVIPEPRPETRAPRAGFVWAEGHWAWEMRARGYRWVWEPGHYEPARPGYVYVDGRWDRDGDYYVWIERSWQIARGGQ